MPSGSFVLHILGCGGDLSAPSGSFVLHISGCGGDLSAPSGSFVSPNFPLPYGRNAECFWTIHGNPGSFIHLQFMDFELESHISCNHDYVEVCTVILKCYVTILAMGTDWRYRWRFNCTVQFFH